MSARVDFDAFARFYDGDYRNFADDIPLVVQTARRAGRAALELGCGTGRVLIPLADAGCDLVGVDRSGALLALARAKAARHGHASRIGLVQADMKAFQLAQAAFDFVFVVSNTLMHLTTEAEQLQALECAYRLLRAGGLLLIDLFNPDAAYLESIAGVQELADRWQDAERNTQVLKWTTRSLDASRQLQHTLFIYEELFPDGRSAQTRISFPLRFWWPDEGGRLLETAGFAVDDLLGDFDGRPFHAHSERLIFIARKP